MNFEVLSKKLENIFNKYIDNPQVHSKINDYLDKQLPNAIEMYIERINRKDQLEKNSEIYIDKFLNNPEKQYFYIAQSNLFIFYNGIDYKPINEDEIWHTLLSDISIREELKPWKHKIKNLTIKKIREKRIINSIPESCTIQNIIQHFTPTLFKSKSEVKYFLILLGDNILKKETSEIHFARLEARNFILILTDHIQSFMKNTNPSSSIKFKYNNQNYEKCRFIYFNESIKIKSCWESFLKTNILNLVAVATHYSKQFKNAELFIQENCKNENITNAICYISKMNNNHLIDLFSSEWLEESNGEGEITWVEMYYLWKSFIKSYNLPIVPVFLKDLKLKLSEKFNYDKVNDSYKMITSSKLLYVKIFQEFWNTTIEEGDDEFEVSELWLLYLDWINSKNIKIKGINEEKIQFLIEHFSQKPIIDGKLISSIKCSLWDKQTEMENIIQQVKIDYNFYKEYDVSIYTLYKDYCSKILESDGKKTVSKKYFEKYITRIIPAEYIKDNQLLKAYWVNF
jgi:hypothetical protein